MPDMALRSFSDSKIFASRASGGAGIFVRSCLKHFHKIANKLANGRPVRAMSLLPSLVLVWLSNRSSTLTLTAAMMEVRISEASKSFEKFADGFHVCLAESS